MPAVDLHIHSDASDGTCSPTEVVSRAAAAGLDTIALTDHDTLDGVSRAVDTGKEIGVRVIPGCEFSVEASWGEMHLLGYFVSPGDPDVESFLAEQRKMRSDRAFRIVRRLNDLGVEITGDDVLDAADGGSLGRPHVARALLSRGVVAGVQEAFDRFLGFGRPAYIRKELPRAKDVAELVRSCEGVTSAAHLKDRAVKTVLLELRNEGVDAVEVLHPSHGESTAQRIESIARDVGMLTTGGSDWHGESETDGARAALGSIKVPYEWLEELEQLHGDRVR